MGRKSLEQQIQDGVEDLRDRSSSRARSAKVADKLGAHETAHRLRHNAGLDLCLAEQMADGLRSGAYRAGHRQNPTVEEQCNCSRFCRGH